MTVRQVGKNKQGLRDDLVYGNIWAENIQQQKLHIYNYF